MDRVIHRNSKVMTILKDLLFSYIITGLLLMLVAFLMLKLDISNKVLSGAIVAIYVISTFVGGFLLGKSAEHKRFLWGLCLGGLYFIVMLLLSIIIHSFVGMEMSGLVKGLLMCLMGGMLGGMIS
ncbi:MAG: TIGR04086 family membrane protein [Anaerocolumna sp.]